jgi:hypothetical protein
VYHAHPPKSRKNSENTNQEYAVTASLGDLLLDFSANLAEHLENYGGHFCFLLAEKVY